jgi:FkbM family methyltransferase
MNVLTGATDPTVIWSRYPTYHGALAFDVGANGGAVASILAQRFEQVIAFEPNMDSLNAMCRNAPDNVVPVCLAVSDTDGPITLRRAAEAVKVGEYVTGTSLAFSWGEDLGPVEVEAVTLDTAARLFGVPQFVKVDTEGHEVAVIQGGMTLLTEHRPRLLIEVHSECNGDEIRRLLPEVEFETVRHPHYQPDQPEWANHYYLVSV